MITLPIPLLITLLMVLLAVLCLWALGQWIRNEVLQAQITEKDREIERLRQDGRNGGGAFDGCAAFLLLLIVGMGVLIVILHQLFGIFG